MVVIRFSDAHAHPVGEERMYEVYIVQRSK